MFSYRDRYFQRKENEEKVLSRRLVHKDQKFPTGLTKFLLFSIKSLKKRGLKYISNLHTSDFDKYDEKCHILI